MGRGILAGLVWGSVVGFGIVTVANQVVDKVYVSPVSLSSEPANDEPANDDSTPKEAVAEMDMGTDMADAPEPSQSSDVARTDAPNVDPALPAQMPPEDQSDVALDMAEQQTAAAPSRTTTQPRETAPDTAPATVDDAATQPSFETPDGLNAPEVETASTPAVRGDSPVLGSPQGVELSQPKIGVAPVQVDKSLPGQKPKPLGTPVAAARGDGEVAVDGAVASGAGEGDTNGAAQNIAEAIADQTPSTPKAAPKIAPQGQKTIGSKVGNFTERTDTMKSTRLPSVAGSAMADAAPVVAAEDLPAIVAFSADYTKAGTAPEMSIILVDIGELDPSSPQLAKLPFPVTYAVDALAPGASERAQMYRAAGLEVLALIGLPDGASAQDVAVTINQARDLVPVSIGFLDVPSASFQATREIAAQVVASAASSGHGIVSFSRGLNALMQESVRADQPAALVFRDFDGRDQNLAAIKRFVDQAAFRAGIDEDIVLVGRAKEDTVTALVEWSLGNRAATVELVPVSYLLTNSNASAQ